MLLERINEFIWGVPVLVLLLGVGFYLSVRTGLVQLRLLKPALSRFLRQFRRTDNTADGSSFRALCTALAATVGTGNIAGVAGAITIGGPGAVFWMWVSGFIGMATKYAEAVLSIAFRTKGSNGEYISGPMIIIEKGLGTAFRPLAAAYSFFGIIAALGVGNATQINAVIGAVKSTALGYDLDVGPGLEIAIGIVMALLCWLLVSGGAGKIASAAELLVPFAAVLYLMLCTGALIINHERIVPAFEQILIGAFSPEAVTGGIVGSWMKSLRIGVSRGVFTNEAGMGTAAIAHGSAEVDHPVQQGLMGIMEVFIDTIVICTMTALVILVSGVTVPYGTAAGSELTADALAHSYGSWVSIILSLCLACFAFATILGWGLYAGRFCEYLFGPIRWRGFALCQACVVFLGAVLNTGAVWHFAEIINALMAIPNLIALFLLSGKVVRLTREYCSGH